MPEKNIAIKLYLLQIEEDGYHYMLPAEINEKKVRLLLDTGASRTVFDKTRLLELFEKKEIKYKNVVQKSVGLGTNSMKSQTAIIKSFKIGNVELSDFQVIVLDLKHVNISYQMIGDEGIAGVLGSDLLKKLNAVINFKNNTLKVIG